MGTIFVIFKPFPISMGCLNYSFKNVSRRSSLLGKHGKIVIVLYTGKIMTSIDLTTGIPLILTLLNYF